MAELNINLNYLIEACGSDKEALKELITLFVNETPKNIENIKNSIANADWNSVKITAHKLKSSYKIFGLTELSDNFSKIEKYSQNQSDYDKAENIFNSSILFSNLVIDKLKHEYSID